MGILNFPISAVCSQYRVYYVGCAVTIGRMKWSTNSDILAVGLEHPLMMGRPTNGVPSGGVLCIFGRKYIVGHSHCWKSGSR